MNLSKKDMSEKIDYRDNSETLYSRLVLTLQIQPDYLKIYSILNNIFNRILNQNTSFVTIKLVGRFAKTDYLLKENDASKEVTQLINDFRSRTKKIEEHSLSELENYYFFDIKALSLFISLIYKTPVPEILKSVFPKEKQYKTRPKSEYDYIRVIVNRWDNNYIYCNSEKDIEKEIKLSYNEKCGKYEFEWSYISSLLYKNAQLNIINPTLENGITIPELIIFEPDYLIDISAIASCFEEYAEDSILYLINKIKPNVNSSSIILGNLASQFLDEEVHSRENPKAYNDSIKSFFKRNSLTLLSTNIERDFHFRAKEQRDNIHKSIGEELPQKISSFDFEKTILEPSFFCEMLGLQGRMDLLQSDFTLLIEQKSGKCGFPQPDPNTPIVVKKHYVQMLLYIAILRYNYNKEYNANNNKLNAFLLYSKYKNSLLGLGFAPSLLYEALKIRNEIVKSEFNYAEGGLNILKELMPEKLNKKRINNSLWNNYIYPQLSELLLPIKNATELEIAYYLQFLKFIENEHIYSKIGNREKENSGFASKWQDSYEDKLSSGNIFDKLSLIPPSYEKGECIEELVLKFNDTTNQNSANFRVGDIVILYQYNPENIPDVRKTIAHRCSIVSIDIEYIKLSLRAPQTNTQLFLNDTNKLWAIEHDFIESSFASLYRSMHKFISAPKERRDLLLLQRSPKIDKTRKLRGDYGNFNDLALKIKQAEELFIIIGPPGTGKTSFGLTTTLKEELSEENSNVLLLSYTNRAVDEICSKLIQENIDFIRIGNKNSCSNQYKEFLLENKSEDCTNLEELKRLIIGAKVFVGTTAAINNNSSLFDLKQFSLAIIDEASQILEPNIIGILSEQRDNTPVIKKIVMIGDHKQLPAVVQQPSFESKTNNKILNEIYLTNCSLSLFERLLKKYRDNEDITYMLTKQGRMHLDIASFPNKQFYNNRLEIAALKHQTEELEYQSTESNMSKILSSNRVLFFDVNQTQTHTNNKINIKEAETIAEIIYNIYNENKYNFNEDETIGVIVPYRNQIATIKSVLQQKYPEENLHNITIDTVERYQGSQRDYVIYGLTIQERYQLSFLTENSFVEDDKIIDRKLNVAMTRARKQLIFVGNSHILSYSPIYNELINYIKSINSLYKYDI